MRIPNAAHESRPWRIREIAPDFAVEDVWALPVHGGAEDFQTLLKVMASLDPANGDSLATRVLFRARLRLGRWFGWDDATGELPIAPFRHWSVYPALIRQIERAWNTRVPQ